MNENGTKILVVDDDAFIREVLASILESGNYGVVTAENGEQAFEAFNADGGIGLVISDMNMPEMNGMELIAKIREKGSDVPIIILTANNEISVAVSALNAGASDYLLKDENIQDAVILSAEKVLEKDELKKQNIRLRKDLAEKNERLEREKNLARKVQRSFLPSKLSFDGLEIGTFYRPSDRTGGSFFDAWETANRVHFMIGDVSGHSTSSALLMAVSKSILNSLGHSFVNPAEIVRTANRMICDIVDDSGMSLSLLYGVFDRSSEELQIVSAGHKPIFLNGEGRVKTIKGTGAVLGRDDGDSWEMQRFSFKPGDELVLYTKGLTEARNSGGDEFGTERLQKLLEASFDPAGRVEQIFNNVADFTHNVFLDDLAMFIMRREFPGR